jgi:phosphonatase-like hydrolase
MKNMQELKLVVCDMAGTTVMDKHEVENCFALSAKQTGLEMTDEEILAVQGWGKRHVFETFWERQVGERNADWLNKVEHSYDVFRQILETHYETEAIFATEGCLELFDTLRANGIAIALTTGFYRKVADIILDKLGWLQSGLVQVSVTSDEVEKGRPEPDMIRKAMELLAISDRKSVINIGDTPSDIESGKRAGVLSSCCVTNGTHTAAQLLSFEPDMAFTSMLHFKTYLTDTFHLV